MGFEVIGVAIMSEKVGKPLVAKRSDSAVALGGRRSVQSGALVDTTTLGSYSALLHLESTAQT